MTILLKRTVLFDIHNETGARMIGFNGWEMPLVYSSQLKEHQMVRQRAGMFDISHMLNIDILGCGSKSFLRRLLANDVSKLLCPGRVLYSCMLNHEGGIIDDLIVYFLAENCWRMIVNAGNAEKDMKWIKHIAYSENFDVDIVPREDLATIAVQGPEARTAVCLARPKWGHIAKQLNRFSAAHTEDRVLISRTGYTGEDGFEVVLSKEQAIVLWMDLIAQNVCPCGLGARDMLRIEAGMNLYGQDMNDLIQPAQAGLSWTVCFKDAHRGFIGRQKINNPEIFCSFYGLKLLTRGIMRNGAQIHTSLGVGEVTSGTISPTLGASIALARMPLGITVGNTVKVKVRGSWTPATVYKLPFVHHGKVVEAS